MLDEYDCLVSDVVKTACLSWDSSSFEVPKKPILKALLPLDLLLYSNIYKGVSSVKKSLFNLWQKLTKTKSGMWWGNKLGNIFFKKRPVKGKS